ncbi:MAG: fibronectin type III domain-containing protein, partial [Clostridia bacterium]|nr:fibronectin type III domain-containing protein [Clostridia bacterium]
ISAMAFMSNSNLRELELPDGLKTIGSYAFESCRSLQGIKIPDSVTYLGNAVFDYCRSLEAVIIGKGVTEIPGSTFDMCNITSVIIPDGVVTIGDMAFYGNCLSNIVIPDSVMQIGSDAFSGTNYMANEDNWEDGVLYIDNCLIKVKEDVTECEIKEDTRVIADWAFKDCENPLDIVIPDSVINIGEAFCYCRTLHSVTIGKGIIDIGSRAFYENSNLKSVTIGKNVKTIGKNAFKNCIVLTEITIPEKVESIGEDAFKGCTQLVCISVEDIASWCKMDFEGFNCNPLCNGGDLYLNGQLVTELIIPEGVTEIAETTFYECSAITSVVFPESLKSIGRQAFYCCDKVTTVAFNEGIENIGEEAFYECGNITSVVIPKSVESIGHGAFDCCDNLKSVYINDLTSWCNIVFDGYWSNPMNEKADLYLDGIIVTELIIPDGITSIGRFAFDGCKSIKSVVIPDSVESIGANAFYSCDNLQSIVIPEGVNTIKEYTFAHCDNLKSVTIPSTVTVIEDHAFSDCDSLSDVYYGATKAQWKEIEIEVYNDALYNAVIHCTDGDIDSNHEHSYESEITKQPTCTSTGTKVFICSCGERYTETIKAKGHKEVKDKAVSATCAKTGLTEGSHCSVCNTVIKKQTAISKKSHSLDKGTVTKAANYKASGTKTYKCIYCKTVLKTETIKRLSLSKVSGIKSTPSATSIKVSWSKVEGAEKYEIYYSTNGKKWSKTTSSKNNITIKKLKKATNYKIKVRAIAGTNKGSYSSVLSTSTAPEKVTVSDLRSKKSKILTPVWKKVSGATGYEVVYSTSNKFTKKTTKTVTIKNAKTTKTTIKKLKKGKKYYVKVRAYKTVSGKKIYGAYSSVKSVKVK